MRGGGEGICVWWRSACENNEERRREGEDTVCGGESVCENNDERRGRTMCVVEKCMRVCSGQGACEEERDEGGGLIKSNVCVGESA